MGLIARLAQPMAGVPNPEDERWWTPGPSLMSHSGMVVNAHTALQSSPVWAAVRLLSESLAMTPIITYQRQSDGGKIRATNHPLYDLLHDSPNPWQTAYQWKRVMMVHALLWGNGYSEIVPGPRGAVDQLIPRHPDAVRMEEIPGGYRYMVLDRNGVERPVNYEDMFHIRGLSLDGISGLSVMRYARESIGLDLAARKHAAKMFGQGTKLSGILQITGKLTPEKKERLESGWQTKQSGPDNVGKVAFLDDTAKWIATGMTNEQAQLIASLDWSVADCARFFNVPLHMIQETSKSTSWGTGIEQLSLGFVTYSLMPWLRNWEDQVRKDLIVANKLYFADFLADILLRGNTKDRYAAYQIAAGGNAPWMTRNEVRRLENMNPLPGMDEPLQPLNMGPTSKQLAAMARSNGYLRLMVHDAAARVVRKEIAAMSKAAKRSGDDADAWRQEVEAFYADHGPTVVSALMVSPEEAERYVEEQRRALLADGPDVMDGWESQRIDQLMDLTLGGDPE
jgi:HK97 family phage portal protein